MTHPNESLGALTLCQIEKVAIGLVCLDPDLAGPARQIGLSVGRRLAANSGLAETAFSDAVEALAAFCRDMCCVNCRLLKTASPTEARLRLENCEEILGYRVTGSSRPVCAYAEGLFESVLQVFATDSSISVTEGACLGKGDLYCEFRITRGNHSRVR